MSRRLIDQLRAKARSTPFPAERDAFNAKADQLEAKMGKEQPSGFTDAQRKLHGFEYRPPPPDPDAVWDDIRKAHDYADEAAKSWFNDNPYSYSWANPEPKPKPKPKHPWRGSMGEHDALWKEAHERALKELERDRPSLSPRVRDILARRMANAEMQRRFGDD